MKSFFYKSILVFFLFLAAFHFSFGYVVKKIKIELEYTLSNDIDSDENDSDSDENDSDSDENDSDDE